MPVSFLIPGPLRPFTDGKSRVDLPTTPADVRAALEELARIHPGVRDRVLTDHGEVRQHVNVFVGTEAIRHTGGLATAVPDGAEISIVPAVSGG